MMKWKKKKWDDRSINVLKTIRKKDDGKNICSSYREDRQDDAEVKKVYITF